MINKTLVEQLISEVKPLLPLQIIEAKWDESMLHLSGRDWDFTTVSAWRLSLNNIVIAGYEMKKITRLLIF